MGQQSRALVCRWPSCGPASTPPRPRRSAWKSGRRRLGAPPPSSDQGDQAGWLVTGTAHRALTALQASPVVLSSHPPFAPSCGGTSSPHLISQCPIVPLSRRLIAHVPVTPTPISHPISHLPNIPRLSPVLPTPHCPKAPSPLLPAGPSPLCPTAPPVASVFKSPCDCPPAPSSAPPPPSRAGRGPAGGRTPDPEAANPPARAAAQIPSAQIPSGNRVLRPVLWLHFLGPRGAGTQAEPQAQAAGRPRATGPPQAPPGRPLGGEGAGGRVCGDPGRGPEPPPQAAPRSPGPTQRPPGPPPPPRGPIPGRQEEAAAAAAAAPGLPRGTPAWEPEPRPRRAHPHARLRGAPASELLGD